MEMRMELVPLSWRENCNIVIGQSHFIKTVEDIAEIVVSTVPGAKFGLAFNEASEPCLVRTEGNDPGLIEDAARCAMASGAGHTFYLILGEGLYPINVLTQIKACQEVCGIFCATANPVDLVVARSGRGAGILGVVDGASPEGVEGIEDKAARRDSLRRFGYKY